MDLVSILVGVALGGVAGFALAFTTQRKKADELEGQLAEATASLSRSKGEVASLRQAKQEAQEALATAKEQVAQLSRSSDEARAEVTRLADTVSASESARIQALEQAKAHQAARQQAEGKARQTQGQATEALRLAEELETQRTKLQDDIDKLRADLQARTSQLNQLQADMDSGSPEDGRSRAGAEAYAKAGASLDKILNVVLEECKQRAVVLADANGIVISAAGDNSLKDGMAATAQVIAQLSKQIHGVVPFETVKAFRMQDGESAVIAGRTFQISGELISLATYGSMIPGDRMLDGAMSNLNAALQ